LSDSALGIHHVTAISGDPQVNLDFYTGVLGLRLVKLTINFDDPASYHLYYGDEEGAPGTLLTFFPWPDSPRGGRGAGQIVATSFAIPADSLEFWEERLTKEGCDFAVGDSLEGERAIRFSDPDGMELELIATPAADDLPVWEAGPVPAEAAIRCFFSVTLSARKLDRVARILEEAFGYRREAAVAGRQRFRLPDGDRASVIDVYEAEDPSFGRLGRGSVHHVALRAKDEESQLKLRRQVIELGLRPTGVLDRKYFRSVYFREPGGILFEIATDPPGMTVDESVEKLGSRLQLPPWLEEDRSRIEERLPKLTLRAGV
jgi:glyoxalase family protein